ncbi:MAG: hypothetical protein Q8O67_13300 [Deltaproteobacteria bacterium]|nr:hypothetical protein [Deltaproteobacteria bacterium]
MLRLLLPLLLSGPTAEPGGTEVVKAEAEDVDVDAESEPMNGISGRLLMGGASVPEEGSFPFVGLGVAYERELYGLLALELALEGVVSPVSQAYLLEAVIEKPIEINDAVGFYFGGGPTVGLHVVDGRPLAGAGGLAMAGVELFLGAGMEIFIEVDTAVIYFDRPIVEFDVGTGVLYRF